VSLYLPYNHANNFVASSFQMARVSSAIQLSTWWRVGRRLRLVS